MNKFSRIEGDLELSTKLINFWFLIKSLHINKMIRGNLWICYEMMLRELVDEIEKYGIYIVEVYHNVHHSWIFKDPITKILSDYSTNRS